MLLRVLAGTLALVSIVSPAFADPPPATAPAYRPSSGALIPVAIYDAAGNIVSGFGGGGGGAGGSVGAAGANGTTAQSVQGIQGGVPQNGLIGQFNTTLPTFASGQSGYVAVDSNGRQILAPSSTVGLAAGTNVVGSTTLRGLGANRSATVGTAAVALMPSNAARQGWKIKNDSTGDLWINFDGTATAAAGGGNIRVPANTYLASEPGFVETGAMSAIGSAAGLAITAREH